MLIYLFSYESSTLEVAYGLDTNSFLNAFFRMASRRGLPSDVLSDNGTNFVGANNELEELAAFEREKIQEKTTSYGVNWPFNPPFPPHFSGVHEVMIKAAKKGTYAILSNADVTDEELLIAVVGAEGLINSRPLTYKTVNPQDPVSPPTTFCTGSWEVGSYQTLWIIQPSILEDAGGESKNSFVISGIGG